MARTTLKKKYGKLTVLREDSIEGRRYALTRCTCGTESHKLVDALRGGRVKSCGHGSCKNYRRVEVDKNYRPTMPRAITLPQLERAWKSYHHAKPHLRKTVPELADQMSIARSTLTQVFNRVRKCGGIEKFRSYVS